MEFGRGNDEVDVAPHGAIRAVALPGDDAVRGVDSPSDFTAVASSLMCDILRAHSLDNEKCS